MSRLRANQITNKTANGAPTATNGFIVSGVCTATDFSGQSGGAADFPNGVTATNVSVAQSVTATTYYGSGSNLTGIDATTIQTGTTKVVTSSTLISNQISGAGIATVQAGGIDVTGIVTATSYRGDGSQLSGIAVGGASSISFNDDVPAVFGTGSDFQIKHDGTYNQIRGVGNHNMYFYTNNTLRTVIEDGGHLRPASNNTYNLGTSSDRWANLYVNDAHFSNEGSTNSVDGTWGDWTLQEGENDIYMINNRTNKKYKMNLTEVD